MSKNKLGTILITAISSLAIVGMFFVKPIAQDLSYHNFVDGNEMFGIPNFWNVVSNLPFLIVGVLGMLKIKRLQIIPEITIAYWILFFGVAMVAFGSGYYHLHPDNHTLVWDRLPMTIAFMSLFAIIIAEFIDVRKGSLLLLPLLFIGAASVFYWQWTESNGVGDLRFYALVQFLPIILIPIILLMYQPKFSRTDGYWKLLLAYIVAKVLEFYDAGIFVMLGQFVSGHSIKHVAAAIGMYILFVSYSKRKLL